MITLTDEQQLVVDKAVEFWEDPDQQIFQYSGYPGTGKTFILYEIIKAIGVSLERIAPMAYIGQAAINMRVNGLTNAKTIHSWLYNYEETLKRDTDGTILIDPYFNRPLVHMKFIYDEHAFDDIDLIIIDEAGSVPLKLKDDIERSGTKIIATGDLGQLPPPCDIPAYLKSGTIYRLTKILRQKDEPNNGILQLAWDIKNNVPIRYGTYGDNCIVIPESRLTLDMMEKADVFICGTNKTRDKFNKIIREQIYDRRAALPEYGDILVCRQNNWQLMDNGINLANGLRGTVTNTPDISEFTGPTFYIDFKPSRIEDCIFKHVECDYEYLKADTDKRKLLKNQRYKNGNKFEYGYAITTHMSQGAQFEQGIYYAEYFGDLTKKLNFTGVTRFKSKLIYVIKDY